MRRILVLIFSFFIALGVAFADASSPTNNDKIGFVSVSIAPQAYFVEQISAGKVGVNVLLPANANEHNFEFKPSSMKSLEKSDIYFTIDLEFEKVFLDKFKQNYPNLKIIDTQDKITLLKNSFSHDEHENGHEHNADHDNHATHEHDAHETHEHHAHDEHEHGVYDIHTWLDPILAKQIAMNIENALSKAYPQNKDEFKENLSKLLAKLDGLDKSIKTELSNVSKREFIVYHPSWGYFAKRYNLTQIPLEIDGKEPKPRDLQRLIKLAKDKNIKAIFVQPGFSENAAKSLAKESGAKIEQINHISFDYENELLKTAKVLKEALK